MKVLALDIASTTGIAVGVSGCKPACWSVCLGKSKVEDLRLSNALKMADGLITKHNPDLIVIEAFIGGPQASSYLIGLVACVRGQAYSRGLIPELVYPSTVRKHFLGKSKTSRDFPGLKPAKAKLAIKQEVADRCKLLGWDVPDLDAADAAATWDYACSKWARGYQAKTVGGLV